MIGKCQTNDRNHDMKMVEHDWNMLEQWLRNEWEIIKTLMTNDWKMFDKWLNNEWAMTEQ